MDNNKSFEIMISVHDWTVQTMLMTNPTYLPYNADQSNQILSITRHWTRWIKLLCHQQKSQFGLEVRSKESRLLQNGCVWNTQVLSKPGGEQCLPSFLHYRRSTAKSHLPLGWHVQGHRLPNKMILLRWMVRLWSCLLVAIVASFLESVWGASLVSLPYTRVLLNHLRAMITIPSPPRTITWDEPHLWNENSNTLWVGWNETIASNWNMHEAVWRKRYHKHSYNTAFLFRLSWSPTQNLKF